jgi:choline-sulfatase
MRLARPSPSTILVAGIAGGVLIGVYDGFGAALRAGVGVVGLFPAALLCAAVGLWVGLVAAILVIVLGFLTRWGRREGAPRPAVIAAWVLLGLGAAAVATAAVAGTTARNNRFLAGGLVALDVIAAGLIGALVGPALARALSPLARLRRAWQAPGELMHQPPPTPAGLLVLAPAAALLIASLVFLAVWRLGGRPPWVRGLRAAITGGLAAALPFGMALAAAQARQVRLRAAALVAALGIVVPVLLFVRANWTKHLQFVPWRDIKVVVLVLVAGVVLAFALRRRTPRGLQLLGIVLAAPPLALLIALWAGGSEGARKAAASEAGLVGPLLGWVRPALDFDGDGYPGLLGGGDCNDRDKAINPSAQDWPEDGIDQDCDTVDLRADDLRPPPLHTVPPRVPPNLNLLLIVIDTLRADRLGTYGYSRPTSPELDRLARDGVVFENAWAHAPSTRYSMPAIITGRWPSAIKWDLSIWWPGISREQPTIAEVLREHGYFNGAYYAYSYFNRIDGRGFERGVDQYDDRLAAKHVNVGGPAESVGSSAREMADDGIDFLRSYKDQKFFLTLHFYDPHLNYERHPEFASLGDTQSDLYDGEVQFTDRHVGRVISALKELGIYDRTAIVVTGDHGEGLGEHGITAHGYDLYAPQTKVPLIVRVPGLPARRVTDPVGHVDIAPTLVNLARAPQQKSFLGRSMVDLIAGAKGPVPPPTAVFQEVSFEPLTPASASTERRAWATATHHLVWKWIPENTVFCYDIQKDPAERKDLWGAPTGDAAATCRQLKADLDRRLSLLRLADLPADFVERIGEGVSAPGEKARPPRVARPAKFGDVVHFKGFDLDIPGAPFPGQQPTPLAESAQPGPSGTQVVRIARGGQLDLTTHFEVTGDLTGWRIFFHLDGPAGTWRNLDHAPVGGAYPVDRWRTGQQIRDRFTLRFGADFPPGRHTLSIGFWRPPSSARKRLPVSPADVQDGQDRLRVVTFSLE